MGGEKRPFTVKVGGEEYSLSEDVTLLGRGGDADIKLDLPGLSRVHARLMIAGEELAVEDLGSKNGTFVNGRRLEAKTLLKSGDKLRLGDVAVTIKFPDSESAGTQAPAGPADTPPVAHVPKMTPAMIRGLIKPAAAAVILILILAFILNYESQGLKEARQAIHNAIKGLAAIETADTLDANKTALAVCRKLRTDLQQKVSPEYEEEALRAAELIRDFDQRIAALEARNAALIRTEDIKRAIAALDRLAARTEAGEMDAWKALAAMEKLGAGLPGSEVEAHALKLIEQVRSAWETREKNLLVQARKESLSLAAEGQFRQALARIDRCLARSFSMVTGEERHALARVKDEIGLMAFRTFHAAATAIVEEAQTGDCDRLQKRLESEMAKIGLPGLEQVLVETTIKIDAIKRARLAAARAALKRELAHADDLDKKRQYAQAAKAYDAVMRSTDEPEMKKDVEGRRGLARLKAAALDLVLACIKREGGMDQEGIGRIASADRGGLELTEEGAQMRLGWDRIRDNEFRALLGRALKDHSSAEGWLAYGLLVLASGKAEQADRYLARAAQADPGLTQRFSSIYAASRQRADARVEEAKLAAVIAPTAETTSVKGPLPAFPGAEGFGALCRGGRGGKVIRVTNLNPSGPGSFQAAVDAEGPRTVVFAVGGLIKADVRIKYGNLTIAGQTAPDPGITIEGMLAKSWSAPGPTDDIIVRFLRLRPPRGRGNQGDAIQISNDGLIIDHCSCCWAEDETIDVYTGRNVTVQWSAIEESAVVGHEKGAHNYGMIGACGPGKNVTMHHNLFSHHARRNPAIANGPADFRNNVVYNFRQGFSHEGHPPNGHWYNIVANYYKKGPSSARIFIVTTLADRSYYIADNFIEGIGKIPDPRTRSFPAWIQLNQLGGILKTPVRVPPVTITTAEIAYQQVLARAGCFPRDIITLRNVNDTKNGTGSWGRKEQPDLLVGLPRGQAWKDSDKDGMADAWEAGYGLNPGRPDHNQPMPNGYTAIEQYCHEMAAWREQNSPKGKCPASGGKDYRER